MADKFNLTDNDRKSLLHIEKYVKKIYLNYIAAGFLLCIGCIGLILGIKLHSQEGFFVALFFGIVGFNVLIVSRTYQKLYVLIQKMKHYIEALEKNKS